MSATTAVAIAGLTATTITAIAALGVNVWLQVRTEHRHVRELRYTQLLSVYTDAGRAMSSLSAATLRTLDAMARQDTEELEATKADIEANDLTREMRHAVNMLSLHDASPEAVEALHAWRAWIVSHLATGAQVGALDERRDEVERLTTDYYLSAGRHARAELGLRPAPGSRSASSATEARK